MKNADWTGFLTTVGRLYKYPYHEQLMIYAQRPDARACAEYDLWNNTETIMKLDGKIDSN